MNVRFNGVCLVLNFSLRGAWAVTLCPQPAAARAHAGGTVLQEQDSARGEANVWSGALNTDCYTGSNTSISGTSECLGQH